MLPQTQQFLQQYDQQPQPSRPRNMPIQPSYAIDHNSQHYSQQQQEYLYDPVMSDSHDQLYDGHSEITRQLTALLEETLGTDQLVEENAQIYREFVAHNQTRSRIGPPTAHTDSGQQLAMIESLIGVKTRHLQQVRMQLVGSQMSIFDRLITIQDNILSRHLLRWQTDQQQPGDINLDLIQSWLEKILEIMRKLKIHITAMQSTMTSKPDIPFDHVDLNHFVARINKAQEYLILSSFVVVEQPPQVIRTNLRFSAQVRFLCCNKLDLQTSAPTVTALLLSERNARNVIMHQKHVIEQSRLFGLEIQESSQEPVAGSSSSSSSSTIGIYDTYQHSTARVQYSTRRQFDVINTESTSMLAPTHHEQSQQAFAPAGFRVNDIMLAGCSNQPMMTTSENHASGHRQFFQQQQLWQQHSQPGRSIPQNCPQQNPLGQQATVHNANMTQPQHFGVTGVGYDLNAHVNTPNYECIAVISNNTSELKYHQPIDQMLSRLEKMQIKKIKRADRNDTTSVTDEKLFLFFFTEVSIVDDSYSLHSGEQSGCTPHVQQGNLTFRVLAFSQPIVVIVHGVQEANAWATITWHTSFAQPDDVMYRAPDWVPWGRLAGILSEMFRTQLGRGLSAQNLEYLASKVCRQAASEDTPVTWEQFAKWPLYDEKPFTFWDWIRSILKLLKDQLGAMWKEGHIQGFISKRSCAEILLGSAHPKPAGTFILRFSDTEPGGISIAWVSDKVDRNLYGTQPTHVVEHLQPLSYRCLIARSLADHIRDFMFLVYLSPNTPKDQAFGAYYTPVADSSNLAVASSHNYVRPMLIAVLLRNYPGVNRPTGRTVPVPRLAMRPS